jgi:hypothetical protein
MSTDRALLPPVPPALRLLIALLLGGLQGPPALADTAEEMGRRLALEADQKDSGFKDSKGEVEMVIRKRRGAETRRGLEIAVLEDRSGGDFSLVRFLSPPDVRGTALLTRSGPRGEDEQWLYLPALKRTKRIASANRSGAFMGSEFAYEDFALRRPEDYAHRYLREDILDGRETWVLERRPKYAGSGYSRQVIWLDQATYRLARAQFWDEKDRPLKTLEAAGYRLHSGRFWRADTLRMGNTQTGDTTWLVWKTQRLGTGLSERDFSRGALGAP